MDIVAQLRFDRIDHRLLDAAAVGDDRTRLEMRHGLPGHRTERLHRRRQEDHVGIGDAFGQVLGKAVDHTEAQGRFQVGQTPADTDHMTDRAGLFQRQGQ